MNGVPANHGAAPIALRAAPIAAPLVLGIGSSAGGPEALLALARGLGSLPVPILLAQHHPAALIRQLAARIADLGGPSCTPACDGESLRAGHIHLAPGNRHLTIAGTTATPVVRLSDAPAEHFCRPAVDPLFRSLPAVFGNRVLVLLLTGMGQDGLAGTRAVVEAGGGAIAQDRSSSVVWGMPGMIAKAGLCHAVLPLSAIAARIRSLVGVRA